MAYDFQPRVPVDHVLTLIGILRGTIARERGDVLVLCGATLGEVGALLKQGLVVTTDAVEVPEDGDMVVAAEQLQLIVEAEPQLDLAPWIPVILKIIELLLARRG